MLSFHIAPTLSVTVPDFTSYVLKTSPYNTFSLTCTATSNVGGNSRALLKTFQWIRLIDSGQQELLTSSSDGVEIITDSNLSAVTSISIINVTANIAGQHLYTCRVLLDVNHQTDDIRGEDSSSVPVRGIHA